MHPARIGSAGPWPVSPPRPRGSAVQAGDDLRQADALAGVHAEHRAADAGFVGARGAVGASAGAELDLAAGEVLPELVPLGVGRLAVLLAGPQGAASGGQVVVTEEPDGDVDGQAAGDGLGDEDSPEVVRGVVQRLAVGAGQAGAVEGLAEQFLDHLRADHVPGGTQRRWNRCGSGTRWSARRGRSGRRGGRAARRRGPSVSLHPGELCESRGGRGVQGGERGHHGRVRAPGLPGVADLRQAERAAHAVDGRQQRLSIGVAGVRAAEGAEHRGDQACSGDSEELRGREHAEQQAVQDQDVGRGGGEVGPPRCGRHRPPGRLVRRAPAGQLPRRGLR